MKTLPLLLAATSLVFAEDKPDILIIYADDLGYGDVSGYNLDEDIGETKNLAAAMPGKVAEMKGLLEKLITEGRSTPGAKQKNDVEVIRRPSAATRNPTR